MAVKVELKKLRLHFIIVDMGVVDILENITGLSPSHFKILKIKRRKAIEEVETTRHRGESIRNFEQE